ncbi:MAG: DUF2147 domain-containing protein [Alphaproteobacteria bacterium HGW-Alphaproteobacteria-3]|nr:MAG: DUF2147 domain-containing protein [Alphaproteobacteria bacterium HGW-Alphaproteobacteria-3]
MRTHHQARAAGLALLLSASLALPASADTGSPLGKWRTFDPDTGAPKTVVEITETEGTLTGTIVELLDDGETTCSQCDGDRKNQPLLGMPVLWGLTKKGDEWSGGTILRPANGKTANASLELTDGGSKLEVTGSKGIMSRSQTWERVE